MKVFSDKDTLLVLSGWFTNLSAAWFAAIVVGPVFIHITSLAELTQFLTSNLSSAIVALALAIKLARMARKL